MRWGFGPWVRKIPLENEMATYSSILAWKIPWPGKPGGLQSDTIEQLSMRKSYWTGLEFQVDHSLLWDQVLVVPLSFQVLACLKVAYSGFFGGLTQAKLAEHSGWFKSKCWTNMYPHSSSLDPPSLWTAPGPSTLNFTFLSSESWLSPIRLHLPRTRSHIHLQTPYHVNMGFFRE